jgi:hypothetical protein
MQLVWGLLVCFITFGAYMMWAPFIKDSDDHLQQLAQLQIFISLVASLSLRAVPPDPLMSSLVGVLLVVVPILGIAKPMYKQFKQCMACGKAAKLKINAIKEKHSNKEATSATQLQANEAEATTLSA